MKIVYPEKLKEAEITLMNRGVSEDELISRASTFLKEKVISLAKENAKILAVAGAGNNGCDVLECALMLDGYDVSVYLVGEKRNEGNRARVKRLKHKSVKFVDGVTESYDIILDGVFGIGLTRAPEGDYSKAIKEINESGAYIISADIPSGLCARSGFAYGECVVANETLTFSYAKSGLIMNEGRNYTGKVTVCDIGIECESVGEVIENATLPVRKPVSHKGDYGRVKVIGGSAVMPGAPLMSFESAVSASRGGAGLVTLCVPESEKCAYQSRVKETMLYFLPDDGKGGIRFSPNNLDEIMEGANAIVIGPGVGKSDEILQTVRYVVSRFDGIVVLDADALNVISRDLSAIENHKCTLILTPHVGEFNRLSGGIERCYIEQAKAFAKKYNCVLAVKSATTIITDGESVAFNVTGTPAMAKGGSGDVLCGIVGAFSCVTDAYLATKCACYHFGKVGEQVEREKGSSVSILASDIIINL